MYAQVTKTLNIADAGTLSTALTPTELTTITNLTLTGTIDARDFKTMRDEMPVLAVLDLSGVNIAEYHGNEVANVWRSVDFPANTIPEYAFYDGISHGKTSLTSVVFPTTMTSFGQFAFGSCTGLTAITIPPSVISIGTNAFSVCNGTTTISIPSSVTSIGDNAFNVCSGFISVDANNQNYSSIDGVLFNKTQTKLIQCPTSKEGSYTIPSSVNSIGHESFNWCTKLNSVIISSSVLKIEQAAFAGCSGMNSIFIASSVTSIGQSAFLFCSGLINVDTNNQNYSSIDGILFNKSKTSLIQCPVSKAGDYTIPSSVVTIEIDAFANCTQLISVEIPFSVQTIDDAAFYGCSGLTSLSLPLSVTSLGNNAFTSCNGLNSLTVARLVPMDLSKSVDVFSGLPKTTCKLYVPYGSSSLYSNANQWKDFTNIVEMPGFHLSATTVNIKSVQGSTATIDITANVIWTASSDQTWLTVSPTSGLVIGQNKVTFTAEANPLKLTRTAKVTISASGIEPQTISITQNSGGIEVTAGNLKTLLADQLSTITNLTLTGTIDARDFKTMRDEMPVLAVLDLSGVNIAEYHGGDGTNIWWFTDYSSNTIPVSAFVDGHMNGKTSLTSIILPSSMTSFGAYAFKNCSGIKEISIPQLVTDIGSNTFDGCSGLKSVTIPSSLTKIGYMTFSGCSGLTSVIIPPSITSIGEYSFSYCIGLKSISIPSSVTSIENYAFSSCEALTTIDIPSSVVSIGDAVFGGCLALASFTIPSSVTRIGYGTFAGCTNLKSVTIPSSITIIKQNFFSNCSSLASITIPSSIVSIEDQAFERCSGLTSVIIGSSVTKIGNFAFSNCNKLASLTVECSVPPIISLSEPYAFYNVDKNACVLNVPYGTTSLYKASNEWKDFKNIVEPKNGFYLSSNTATIASSAESTATIDITADVDWIVSCDQSWLTVNPTKGTGNQTLTFNAKANTSVTKRVAIATVSSTGFDSKTITISQNGLDVAINISPGGLSTALNSNELNTVTNLILTGIIDARDFKTMRDNMPQLKVLDLSGVNIAEYRGSGGPTIYGNNNYPANTIPEFAFYNGVEGKNSLSTIVFPLSVTSFGQKAFGYCSGLTSISVDWQVPVDLSSSSDVFIGWDKNACILNVPYGTAPRYATANQWKDFTRLVEVVKGFNLSLFSTNIAYLEGATASVDITSNIDWTASSDQDWLAVNPKSGNGNLKLTFTAKENTLDRNRIAVVTVSGNGVTSRKITITQNIKPQPIKTLANIAGQLSSSITTEVLNTILKLTLTGTIDARDFKTMRDKMPVLAELDISGANIVAYSGKEGTSVWDNQVYPANTIPETAFLIKSPWNGDFSGKTSLKSIILPSSLLSLGYYAFMYCNGITNIVIPSSVTSIRDYAFYLCEGLTSVSIPSSVKSIESYAFGSCHSLTSVNIPSTVTSIGSNAFSDCKVLTSIIIPSSVTSIGSGAFGSCSGLTSITVNWSIPLNLSSSSNAFYNVNKNTCILKVPYGTASRYAAANQWKEFTHIVEMPGFFLSETAAKLGYVDGSMSKIAINSDVAWTVSSDQTWLVVSPVSGNGIGQKLTFTSGENSLFTTRTAKVIVSATGVESQTITVTQDGSPINLTPGGLTTVLSVSELSNITKLTITGTMDARDFKTMRDMMPLLAELDLSGANIVAYKGYEGTSIWGNNDYPANEIPESALYNGSIGKPTLTSVVLPLSLTSIGQSAFGYCNGLRNVIIPSLVNSIGNGAFRDCQNLTSVNIPPFVSTIASSAFLSCRGLTSLTVGCSVPPDLKNSANVFYSVNKSSCILHVPYGTASRYAAAYQWKDFLNIVEATEGFNLTSNIVPLFAAEGGTANIDITANINWTANSDQTWLVVSPSSGIGIAQKLIFTAEANPLFTTRKATVTISAIGSESQRVIITQERKLQPPRTLNITAGSLSSALTSVEQNTITDLTLVGTIDARDFKTMRDNMPLLSKLNLSGATIVAYNGIGGTSIWQNNDYPANTIPEFAFMNSSYIGKTSLTSVLFPSSLIAFGQYSFLNCSGIKEVIIPSTVTSIGNHTFYGCKGLSGITIPSKVSSIGLLAFGSFYGLIGVDPDNLNYSSINGVLFNKAQTELIQCPVSKTGNFKVPLSVTSIGSYAFSQCYSLTGAFSIPSSVISIGTNSFYGCTGLTSISIPVSVTSIGEAAFSGCAGLSTIYAYPVSPINLETSKDVFYNVYKSTCTLYIPAGSKSVYQAANQWKDFTKVVEFNPVTVANAGPDQVIYEGTQVTLDGTGSTNSNFSILTYQWTAPLGITLSSETSSKPTFTAPKVTTDTNFTFSLVVKDGAVNSLADQVVITVKQVNKSPMANAGPDQTISEGSVVTLDGSGSTSASNNVLTYKWTAPVGISLSSETVAKPTFTAPEVTTDTNFTFSLIVKDGSINSLADQVVITVKQVNKSPMANAGPDQTISEGSVVTLDGSGSTSASNNELTYKWTAPVGISLSSETVAKPTFTAPEVSQDTPFTFTLVVNDGTQSSIVDQVVVTVKQIFPILKLTSKTNNLLLPTKEVTYHLFLKKNNSFSEENLSPIINGDATQFSIEPGEWIVLASPVQNSVLFVPTYLGNVLNWDDAEHIIIADKGNIIKEITCFMPEPTNIGLGQISGYVYEDPNSGTKSISITKSLQVSGSPIQGALIRLFKKGSTIPISSVFSDSQGYYKFDRLEIADYNLIVELPGFEQPEKIDIVLSNAEPLTTANFSVNSTLQIITDNKLLLSSSINFYPNPTNGVVNIIGLPLSQKSEIAIYAIDGKLVKAKTTSSITEVIDISDQISAMYILIVNKQPFKIWKK
jgi:hypothetical protein